MQATRQELDTSDKGVGSESGMLPNIAALRFRLNGGSHNPDNSELFFPIDIRSLSCS